MKYVDEFRDPAAARRLIDLIHARVRRPRSVMEVCGGQTHTLLRAGIDQLLEGAVDLIHGPGCPVCVTPLEKIDRAVGIARSPNTMLATYGDMTRVPGSNGSLLEAKAEGADLRIVYSPMDAVTLAERHPERQVAFFAVGFETTAPANAMAVREAARRGLSNFSLLSSHVRVPPAIELLLSDPHARVEGFIAPGHVCAVMGWREYDELSERYGVPFVVAGFEPLDLLQALHMLVEMLEAGEAGVRNQYVRAVRHEGNLAAQRAMAEVFEVADIAWRGIGIIPRSGLRLAPAYRSFDAEERFGLGELRADEHEVCIAGEVLQGRRRPSDCPAFGGRCTPTTPLGAPMVSSEGACAAYHAYRRDERGRAATP